MGRKLSGYELFVKEMCGRMRREGSNPNYVEQLGKLGSEYSSLPDEVKQQYKDRAKNGGGFQQSRPPWKPSTPSTSREPAFQTSDTSETQMPAAGTKLPSYLSKPSASSDYSAWQSTSNRDQAWGSYGQDVKPNGAPYASGPGSQDSNVDSKPVIKEERGTKRKLDVDMYTTDEQRDDSTGRDSRVPPEPPKKKGFSIPNWKNIKNSSQPEADRYFDYDMVKRRNSCEAIVNNHIDRLLTFPLYSFSCNVLCKHREHQGDKPKYIPLEIAIAAYTIKDGLQGSPFHALIDSGPVPSNHWGDTSDHMLATHKIKVTRDGRYPPGSRSDFRKLYKEMLKYVREGERTILVADTHDLEQVQGCIEWLYDRFALDEDPLPKPSTWTILPLVEFVAAAYNHVYCKMLKYPLPKFTLHYFLRVRLETSLWDYEVDLMCAYHKIEDNQSKWCAQNCAIRAFKAIELTLDEIFKHYKHHEEIERAKPQREAPRPPSTTTTTTATNRAPSSQPESALSTHVQQPVRVHAQQRQQPLHMPEDKPAPLIEDKARREEKWRQELEEARKSFPEAPYFQGYYEIPVNPIEQPMITYTDPSRTSQTEPEAECQPDASSAPTHVPAIATTAKATRPPDEELKKLDPRFRQRDG